MEVFGFEIKRRKAEQDKGSVVSPTPDDGSTVVSNAAAYYGLVIDLEGVVKNESDLIRRYRESAQYGDCDLAIEDIVNEAIVADDTGKSVTVVLDDLKVSESIKTKIRDEFNQILRLYKFSDKSHDMFHRCTIDGPLS